MKLQTRDLKLFSSLHQYGVLSTAQISQKHFSGIAITTVLRRLRKLEKGKWIARTDGLENGLSAWFLTSEGARKIGKEVFYRFTNRNTILHEVTLSELRIRLEGINLGKDWVKDKDLYRMRERSRHDGPESRDLFPDGVFIAMRNKEPIAIAVELELQTKAGKRYERLFAEYTKKDSLYYLWYIVESAGIGNTVLQVWSKGYRRESGPELMVTVLENFLQDGANTKIYFSDGKAFKIREILDVELAQPPAQALSRESSHNLDSENPSNAMKGHETHAAPDAQKKHPSAADPSPSTSERGQRLQVA